MGSLRLNARTYPTYCSTFQIQTFQSPFTTLDDCNRETFVAYQLFIKPLYGCLHTHTHTHRDICACIYGADVLTNVLRWRCFTL